MYKNDVIVLILAYQENLIFKFDDKIIRFIRRNVRSCNDENYVAEDGIRSWCATIAIWKQFFH